MCNTILPNSAQCVVGILNKVTFNKVLKCCQTSPALTILSNAENVTLATIKCFVPDSYLLILSSHCENTSQLTSLNVLVSDD